MNSKEIPGNIHPKRSEAPSTPWKEKFFETVPMVDVHGKPIPQNPPLTKFWDKPKFGMKVKKVRAK